MAIDFSKYGTPTAPGQPTTGGTFSKYGTPVETPPDITNDETFWSKFRSGQPTFPVDRNDGIVTNVAKTLGNVPSSYMKIAGGVLDAPEIYKASKDIAEQNDKSMLKTQVAVTKSLVEDLWSLAKKGYEGWENVGQKIYSDLERNTLDQKSVTEGVKITGAQYTGKALEVILNDPLLIPTLFYAPNRLKGTGLTVEKTADGGKVLKTTQGEVVTVMDKSGDIVFGKKPPQDIITKVARPVIDTVKAGTASVARKALPTYEESVAKVANTYKDALPLTPSQKLDEEILLKKTGSNVYRTLAEEGIPLGTGDEVVKLQSISDKISDLSSVYSKEETALFSIKRILEDFEKHIEKNLQTPSARISALKKIKSEVEMVVSDVKNKVDVVTDAQGNILVKAPIADRLRKMGNEIGKYKDPENLGKSIGWGFSNAVRDEVERMSQFPAYRELNRRWGATIHAQQVLDDIEKAGKKFRRVGGLSGSMAQRILSGLFGYHMAGIPGAILSELGSEYAAAVLSNPKLRTWFSRRVLDLHLDDTPSDKAIKQLKAEIDAYKAKVDENMKKGLALPAPSNKTPIPLGAKPDESGITVTEAERIVVRNPKTGKFERAYTSQSLDSEKRVQNQAIENAPAIKNKNSISPTVPPKATLSTPLSTKYYHGTNNPDSIRSRGFSFDKEAQEGSSFLGDNFVEGVYLSKSKTPYMEGGQLEDVVEVLEVSTDAKNILKINSGAELKALYNKYNINELSGDASIKLTNALKKEGYEGAEFMDEVVIFDPKKLKVTPTPERSSALLQEAKNYKSAEEFVKKQPVVYHGSGVPLKKFNNKQGTFFTDDMMNADGYAGGENVYEGYLNLKNPLVIDAKGALHRELDTKWGKTTQEVVGNVDKTKYDGVIFKNIKDSWIDDAEYDTPSTIYYAFKPADAFLNESQLTDIWKKANATDPKNFKTAEEFVNSPRFEYHLSGEKNLKSGDVVTTNNPEGVYTSKNPDAWKVQLDYERGKTAPQQLYLVEVANPSDKTINLLQNGKIVKTHESISKVGEVKVISKLGTADMSMDKIKQLTKSQLTDIWKKANGQ